MVASNLALVLSLLIEFPVSAQVKLANADVCTDAAKVMCSRYPVRPKNRTIQAETLISYSYAKIMSQKKEVEGQFRLALQDDYLRNAAVKTFGLVGEALCKDKSPVNVQKCDGILAEKLFQISILRLMLPAQKQTTYFGDLADLAALANHPRFIKIIKEMRTPDSPQQTKIKNIQKKIHDEFLPEAKVALIKKIKSLGLSQTQKKYAIEKINSVEFSQDSCSYEDNDDGSVPIDPALILTADYHRDNNTVRICEGFLLMNPSEDVVFAMLVHEIVHSITPCSMEMTLDKEGFHVGPFIVGVIQNADYFSNLSKCLRHKNSASARILNEGKWDFIRRLAYINDFCHDDQLEEAIPDWFAAEIYSDRAQKLFSDKAKSERQEEFIRAWAPMTCAGEVYGSEEDVHPQEQIRRNRILMQQPKVRELLGCPPTDLERGEGGYCDGISKVPISVPSKAAPSSRPSKGVVK